MIWNLVRALPSERKLVLYIGSSIGNFEPEEAQLLLERIRGAVVDQVTACYSG